MNEDRPTVGDAYVTVLVQPASSYMDDSAVRSALRRTLVGHLAFRPQGIPNENRVQQLDVIPTEIGHGVLTDITHAHPDHDRQSQCGVDKDLAKL